VDLSILPWPGFTFAVSASASAEQVEQSYIELAADLGIQRKMLRTVRQVHGVTVCDADDSCESADAIYTKRRDLVIGVKLADCCGVLIHDPIAGVVAAVHSGWRGTAGNIVGATLHTLVDSMGANPSDVRVWLSPCASCSAYQVGTDVHNALERYCVPDGNRWFFDNRRAIVDQCVEMGVKREKISVHPSCTILETQWHSYRRNKELSGRMLAFIGLRH